MVLSSVILDCTAPGGIAVPGEEIGELARSDCTPKSRLDLRLCAFRHALEGDTDLAVPGVHVGPLGLLEVGKEGVVRRPVARTE